MPPPIDNYIIARDSSEAERLEDQHRYMISCQGYYIHPDIDISQPNTRIADFGTGTGIFLREIAEAYPSAECHGFDISDKMFPASGPANLELHVADLKKPFDNRWIGYFDVVHLRLVEAAMKKDQWAPALQNLITLLKPGGWLQWVEDDRAHAVRNAVRPVAPLDAAKESLLAGKSRFVPPRVSYIGHYSSIIMPNDRADDMTFGYMNLHMLMRDPEVGNLEQVGNDAYIIDRDDDGGVLRRDFAMMGVDAVWSMLKPRQQDGELTNITRDELAKGYLEDVGKGGHYVTRVGVFTGRKKQA